MPITVNKSKLSNWKKLQRSKFYRLFRLVEGRNVKNNNKNLFFHLLNKVARSKVLIHTQAYFQEFTTSKRERVEAQNFNHLLKTTKAQAT